MAHVIDARCTNCGAPLDVPSQQGGKVKCKFCGLSSFVRPLDRAPAAADRQGAPAHPSPPGGPYQQVPPQIFAQVSADQATGGATKAAGIIVILAIFGVVATVGAVAVGLLMMSSASDDSSTIRSKKAKTKAQSYEFSDKPMLAEVNGDDVTDVIGHVRDNGSGTHWIAAFDGRTAKEIWRTPNITKQAHEHPAVRAVVGGHLISADSVAQVTAYDVETGEQQWQVKIPEKPDWICATGDVVGIFLANRQMYGLDAASGAVRPAPDAKTCGDVHSSKEERSLGQRIVSWSEFDDIGLPREAKDDIEGFTAQNALIKEGSSVVFLLGQRSPGTAVPMIAAHDKRSVLWKVEVPAKDPLEAHASSPVAALQGERLLFPYAIGHGTDEQHRIACLDSKTGRRIWDIAVPKAWQSPVNGIAASERHVFFGQWSALHIFDLTTGKHRQTIGR